MDKVQAIALGKVYDNFYNVRSKRDADKVNAAGNKQGEGFGQQDDFGTKPGKRASRKATSKGKRASREATSKDILRAGIKSLKKSNASLARFIAARYSPKAIAKYQDKSGRLKRSKRLQKQIRQINQAFYMIKGYAIYTSTDTLTPYSCSCPDFSQLGDNRNWLGSKAGPFNPCKHMMAVRDAKRGCKDPDAINFDPSAIIDNGSCDYEIEGCTNPLANNYNPDAVVDDGSCTFSWSCVGGACKIDPEGIYSSQDECESNLDRPLIEGGQDTTLYAIAVTFNYQKTTGPIIKEKNFFIGVFMGPISEVTKESVATWAIKFYVNGESTYGSGLFYISQTETIESSSILYSICYRLDRLPDIGEFPSCPI